MGCSAWSVFFMPISQPPLVGSHMSPAFCLNGQQIGRNFFQLLLNLFARVSPRFPLQVHIEGVSYNCDICGKTSGSKNGLQQHKAKYHRYPPTLPIKRRSSRQRGQETKLTNKFNRNVTYTSQSTPVPMLPSKCFTFPQTWFHVVNIIILSPSSFISRPRPHPKHHPQLEVEENVVGWLIFCGSAGNYVTARWIHRPSKRRRPEGEIKWKAAKPQKTSLIQWSDGALWSGVRALWSDGARSSLIWSAPILTRWWCNFMIFGGNLVGT